MPSKKKDRAFEHSMMEGVVIGHFAEFKDEMRRAFINKETGEEDGQISKPPKIRPGILVQVGEQRLTINVEDDDVKLEYGTPPEKVTMAARKKVKAAIEKKLPFGAEVKIKVKTASDNGWKRYFVIPPEEG